MFKQNDLCPNTGTPATAESKGAMTGDPTVCSECGTTLHTSTPFRHEYRSHTVTTRIPVPIYKIFTAVS